MATFNKFFDFVEQLGLKKHDLNGDQLNVYLTNNAPSQSADTILSDLTQISSGNGYTTDGIDTQNTWAESSGTATLTGTKAVWTCSSAPMGTFQYVVLMNVTQTSPLKPLIGWWDYASAVTLQVGETFSVKFNSSDTTGTILTLA